MLRAFMLASAVVLPAAALAQPQILSNRWDSAQPSSFSHVLQGAAGSRVVRLDAHTTLGEPVAVSVYPRNPDGRRGEPRLLTAAATAEGDSRAFQVELPPPGRLPVVVVVENTSGRRSAGEYTLTVAP